MTLPLLPMHLNAEYHAKLNPDFIPFLLQHFNAHLRGYWHWSAGGFDTTFEDYHCCIKGPDGSAVVRTYSGNPFEALKPHTYHRNSDAIGMGAMCMAGATAENWGDQPLTPDLVEAMIRETVSYCENYRMAPQQWMTHAEAGDNKDFPAPNSADAPHDSYGPESTCERWDLWAYYNPITRELRTAHRGADGKTAPAPEGFIYLPDYMRGEAALRLQTATERFWHPQHGKGG